MKIDIYTTDARALKQRIASDAENGGLKTWEIRTNNENDKLLTHSLDQWADRVLLKLTPNNTNNVLSVTPRYWSGTQRPSSEEYGTILGRFCERLFVQYYDVISSFNSDPSR